MNTSEKICLLEAWRSRLEVSLKHLRQMAGSTEHEFLRIGSQLQSIYRGFTQMSSTANRLAEIASGEHIVPLIEKLNHIIGEMEKYLVRTDQATGTSGEVMRSVEGLLSRIDDPLDGFKRMSKHLYILEVSIKIESARMGEKGSEFINLAQDIKKLSQQIKEKAGDISDNRQHLARLLKKNLSGMSSQNSRRDEAVQTLTSMQASLGDLQEANSRFSVLGREVATVSDENSHYLSTVVQSMQFHDIFRQQVEHVVEALEGLADCTPQHHVDMDEDEFLRNAMGRIGDVCELQEAQLQFAASEFHEAVSTILINLRDINSRQQEIAGSMLQRATDSSGQSFIEDVGFNMEASVKLLDNCARANDETTSTMHEVTAAVDEMTGFVAVIEDIGNEIIQISLNARIKASGTGTDGDALSVLAEEIGQLSNDAVSQTGSITETLTEIHEATNALSSEVDTLENTLGGKLTMLKKDSASVLSTLGEMERELVSLVGKIRSLSGPMRRDIDRLCSSVDVHKRIAERSAEVLTTLGDIFRRAREHYPASDEFKEDLRRMAEKYTMESERRIHEAISSRHGIQTAGPSAPHAGQKQESVSEFGDNVDLF